MLDPQLLIHLAVIISIYGILALSMNLIIGMTGLFTLGHAAFFGVGAYTSAILMFAGVPWFWSMLAGVALAGLLAFLIGIPTLRLVGDYLAIVTLGLAEITRAVFKNWIPVTRGPMGLPGIPHAALFGFKFDSAEKFLGLGIVCLAIVFIISQRIVYSPFGRVLKGIREDESATESLGKNTYRFKMIIFIVGCGMAGLAGSLYAHYIGFIDPSSFVMWLTFFIILIIMLGGLGNNVGALVATVVFVLLREGLRFVSLPEQLNPAALQQLIFGLLLIVITIFAPRGLIPERKITYRRDHDAAKT
ncbi:MAG: branched-chain amino acid ABC transporter permease [Nitrososphaerales archaeon]